MKARIDRKQFFKAGVWLIAALMVLSTVLVTADTSEEQEPIFIEATQNGEEIITSENFHPLESLIYLYYDSDTNVDAIGLTSGGNMEAAARFTPDELTPYDGWELTTVRWHHGYTSSPPHDVIIKIYETTNPTNPGTPITTEPFYAPQQGWFEVPLTSPVTIDISNDYWIGIESTHLAGEYPHGVGPGPHVVGKGDWVKGGGGPWQSLYDASGGALDYNWNVQAGLEEGGGPLTCDADGPYEGIVGEEIQFDGSATGGAPPYSYHWDFGDDNTSEEEDPVHAYAEAGNYTVVLTVTDDEQTVDDDTTWALITEVSGPEIEIGEISGGFGVSSVIKNVGNGEATDVNWSITLDGGLIILGKETTGTIASIPAEDEATVKSSLILGIGSVTITVAAECAEGSSDEGTASGFVILFFVIGVS